MSCFMLILTWVDTIFVDILHRTIARQIYSELCISTFQILIFARKIYQSLQYLTQTVPAENSTGLFDKYIYIIKKLPLYNGSNINGVPMFAHIFGIYVCAHISFAHKKYYVCAHLEINFCSHV